jgi:hypothetical protein
MPSNQGIIGREAMLNCCLSWVLLPLRPSPSGIIALCKCLLSKLYMLGTLEWLYKVILKWYINRTICKANRTSLIFNNKCLFMNWKSASSRSFTPFQLYNWFLVEWDKWVIFLYKRLMWQIPNFIYVWNRNRLIWSWRNGRNWLDLKLKFFLWTLPMKLARRNLFF